MKGSITDIDLVDSLFEQEEFDMVVNFVSESHVDNLINNSNIFADTNVIGTTV